MSRFFSEKISSIGEVSLWKTTETEDDLLSLRRLSKSEQSHLQLLKNPQKRLHWLSYRILLKEMLGGDFEMAYSENGKPVLISPKKFLSVSHSKDFAAIFLSDTQEIGIDIEKITDRIQKLFPRFLSPTEQQNSNLSDSVLLHLYWGAKEAVYKQFSQYRLLFAEQIQIAAIDMEKQQAVAKIQTADFQTETRIFFRIINDYMLVGSC